MQLNIQDTEKAIKHIKDTFEKNLAKSLKLTRVSAPLFVLANQGINDSLSGDETPISFDASGFSQEIQIVHSLAKWKRIALKRYGFKLYEGLYTDMNAIRKHEIVDEIHSLYVDQWDWESIISEKDRNLKTLKIYVKKIVKALSITSLHLNKIYPELKSNIENKVTFITSKQLLSMYPDVPVKERERLITKQYGVVFLIGIGDEIKKNIKHDGRAPDYDDWKMNGDLLIYFKKLDIALELSSMGIRVNKDSLLYQMNKANKLEELNMPYHKLIMDNALPFTIGGGIGQSRLCQFLLNKHHIGEVQVSVWPDDEIKKNEEKGIHFL